MHKNMDHLNSDGYLFSGVYTYQKERINLLDNNSVPFPDMAWEIDGKILYDTRSVYTSSYFDVLFRTELTKDIRKEENLLIFKIDVKLHIFEMIRVFCHTGLVRFSKGETILKIIERYSAFHFFDIEVGKSVLIKLISDNLTPTNVIQAFEFAVCRDDEKLIHEIREYMINYAFQIFNHRNFMSMKRESFVYLIDLCLCDNINIKELDLLECMYKLCNKKIGDKEFQEFDKPIQIMKFKFGEYSMWDCLRLESIKLDEFMEFIYKYENFMSNSEIVETLKYIHKPKYNSKKRKTFQTISPYPRNLNFRDSGEPQGDIVHWDRERVQVFFTFDFSNQKITTLPSIVFRNWNVQCSVKYIEKCLCVHGSLNMGSLGGNVCEEPLGNIKLTARIVNFIHGRWKKSYITGNIKQLHHFEIPNVISCNAIEGGPSLGGGYLFDIKEYPNYRDGTWLMMSISVEEYK